MAISHTTLREAPINLFDAHFHIIDPQFPLTSNRGYLPPAFTAAEYCSRMSNYQTCGGAVVSGSFQAFDQSYLRAALQTLGPGYVGVTQLPADVSDDELRSLDQAGVRAVRFNLRRGGSEDVRQLEQMAVRVHELVGWHVELYADAADLKDLYSTLTSLPAVSIDHLGLSSAGFPLLLKLAEQGVRVKATGFGRVDFDVAAALRELDAASPQALMFGTDLPSTRAPRPFRDEDVALVIDTLGSERAAAVLADNAREFYRINAAEP